PAVVLAVCAGAAYVTGVRVGSRSPVPPAITQLTFRSGDVRGARFSPDGKTVLYAAAWEGAPLKLYSMRLGSPESSPIALPDANLLAVSSGAELALAVDPRVIGPFIAAGTLARVPFSGGAPRQLLENVTSADWTPDGRELAAIFGASGRQGRLE